MANFQMAIRVDPGNSNAYCGRAAVYNQKGDFPHAIADCSVSIRLNPKNGNAWFWRGYNRGEMGDYDNAVADIGRAIELVPRDPWNYYGRGAAEHNSGHFDKAIKDYSTAIELDPKFATAYWARSLAWEKKRDLDKAIRDTSEAIRLKPAEAVYRHARADLRCQTRDLDGAIADANEAVRLDPRCAAAYCDRSYYFSKKGDIDSAIADLTQSLRLDPKRKKTLSARCWMYAEHGKFDKALADANTLVRMEPDNAESYRLRGTVYENNGNKARANQDYDRCRQLSLAAVLRELDLPPAIKQPKAAVQALEKRIKEQVKSLEYSDEVAQGVVTLVRDWNLVVAQELDTGAHAPKNGVLSTSGAVKTEQKLANELARIISTVIWQIDPKNEHGGRELYDVAREKTAWCQGMTLLYFVLGNAIGLSTEGLEVELTARGPQPSGNGHDACLVRLADGSMIMVDETGGLGDDVFISPAFHYDDDFRPSGSFWELKDKTNPHCLHQVVQPANAGALVAQLYYVHAQDNRGKGKRDAALKNLAEAERLNPRFAYVYELQGLIHWESNESDKAIADMSAAIMHNPNCARAYAERGEIYAESGTKSDVALRDFCKAIELNPQLVVARGLRAHLYAEQGKLDDAMADIDKAIEADSPSAKAFERAGGYGWKRRNALGN